MFAVRIFRPPGKSQRHHPAPHHVIHCARDTRKPPHRNLVAAAPLYVRLRRTDLRNTDNALFLVIITTSYKRLSGQASS
jgi:hypothetical protein